MCVTSAVFPKCRFFDESTINAPPRLGHELVLARYELHRNYCGMLLYFAQFTDRYARNPTEVQTPGYQWQIRCDGQPRDPYLTFDRIINPLGFVGFPHLFATRRRVHPRSLLSNGWGTIEANA